MQTLAKLALGSASFQIEQTPKLLHCIAVTTTRRLYDSYIIITRHAKQVCALTPRGQDPRHAGGRPDSTRFYLIYTLSLAFSHDSVGVAFSDGGALPSLLSGSASLACPCCFDSRYGRHCCNVPRVVTVANISVISAVETLSRHFEDGNCPNVSNGRQEQPCIRCERHPLVCQSRSLSHVHTRGQRGHVSSRCAPARLDDMECANSRHRASCDGVRDFVAGFTIGQEQSMQRKNLGFFGLVEHI